jgi:hypothetical protein
MCNGFPHTILQLWLITLNSAICACGALESQLPYLSNACKRKNRAAKRGRI